MLANQAWPDSVDRLRELQIELARLEPPAWTVPEGPVPYGGCFIAFPRGVGGPGYPGDIGHAGAALVCGGTVLAATVAVGPACGPYEPGYLALREGSLLERAVRQLPGLPDILLVNSTGRDHPRRAGMALHLGAVLDVPTVGVTHRPLAARGDWPEERAGARSPLVLDGETVGFWLRTARHARPLAVHAAWRTSAETAAQVVLSCLGPGRTPLPVREARRMARTARAGRL